MPIDRKKRPLTFQELEELVGNIDLDQSDIDENILSVADSDDTEDLIPTENEQAAVVSQSDNDWSSSDEEPLSHLIPVSSKHWIRDKMFQPPENAGTVIYDDHVESPYKYFQKYITDSFFEDVATLTNMREVSTMGRSLETSAVEIQKVFGCSMLIGIYGLPRFKMYWARDTRVSLVAGISRNRFFKLWSRLKIVDDNAVSEKQKSLDRFWKVRPILDAVQRGCRLNERTYEVSIDEQMIPFTGHVTMRQFVRGKPNPVGLKNFVMATPTGIPLDFYIYEGKGSSVESVLGTTPEKLDVGGRMVLKLTDTLPVGVSVFTDRYFTSIPLIDSLASRCITLAGTIMASSIPKNALLLPDNELKKRGSGSYDYLVRDDGKIAIIKWFDNKPVYFATSDCGVEPEGVCRRWLKLENKHIHIKQPAIVNKYNLKMGGVDLLDRVIGKYAMRNRTNKWTVRTIYHFIDFAVAAGWLEYRENAKAACLPKKEVLDYLEFKLSVAKALVAKNGENISMEVDDFELEGENSGAKRRSVQPIPDKRSRQSGNIHLVNL